MKEQQKNNGLCVVCGCVMVNTVNGPLGKMCGGHVLDLPPEPRKRRP